MNNEKSNHRRRDFYPLGIGVVLGLVLGAAMDNIALGLTFGIIIGGIIVIWKKKK